MPIDRGNGVYALEFGELLFEVDSKVGARIVTFAFDGENILTGPTSHPTNYGSTLSLSPQNGANGSGWPPPPDLDAQPYQVTVNGTEIEMQSGSATVPGGTVQVTKRFTPDFARAAVNVEYVIQNVGTTPVSWAAWEISRVLPNGITFFPSGTMEGPTIELTLQKDAGHTWWLYAAADINAQPHGDKAMADGSGGWLAHGAGTLLFLKTFPDIPVSQQAPAEAEISIYASKPGYMDQGAYVEIEPQSAYTVIAPGSMLSWSVMWTLRRLPAGADLTVGDPELLSFVQGLVQ